MLELGKTKDILSIKQENLTKPVTRLRYHALCMSREELPKIFDLGPLNCVS